MLVTLCRYDKSNITLLHLIYQVVYNKFYLRGIIMTYDELMKHFGSGYRAAIECHFSGAAPYNWKRQGYIPIQAQIKIEKVTKGALKANLDDCKQVNDVY